MSPVPRRRLAAFALDVLAVALGAIAGFLLALLVTPSTGTHSNMGVIVVFFILPALGVAVFWIALAGIVIVTGRSPGQRLMKLRYADETGYARRACHVLAAWLLPVALAVVPVVLLEVLADHRAHVLERWEREHDWTRRHGELAMAADDLRYAYRDGRLNSSEYEPQRQAVDRELAQLEGERQKAVWYVPEWLVDRNASMQVLLPLGASCGYVLLVLFLLLRPPHVTLQDRLTGARIVAA